MSSELGMMTWQIFTVIIMNVIMIRFGDGVFGDIPPAKCVARQSHVM